MKQKHWIQRLNINKFGLIQLYFSSTFMPHPKELFPHVCTGFCAYRFKNYVVLYDNFCTSAESHFTTYFLAYENLRLIIRFWGKERRWMQLLRKINCVLQGWYFRWDYYTFFRQRGNNLFRQKGVLLLLENHFTECRGSKYPAPSESASTSHYNFQDPVHS